MTPPFVMLYAMSEEPDMHSRIGKRLSTAVLAAVTLLAFTASVYAQGGIGMSYSEKARMLEDALRMDPANANILVQLGNTYYDWGFSEINLKGDNAQPGYYWSQAINYYGRALEKKPDDPNVRTDRANLIWYTGNAEEAAKEYIKVKKAYPHHVQSRTNLIKIYGEEMADYKAAIQEYEELIKAVPDMANDMSLKQTIDQYRVFLNKDKPKSQETQPDKEQIPEYEFKF